MERKATKLSYLSHGVIHNFRHHQTFPWLKYEQGMDGFVFMQHLLAVLYTFHIPTPTLLLVTHDDEYNFCHHRQHSAAAAVCLPHPHYPEEKNPPTL